MALLESIKTRHDLVSSLNADKYLLNKFQIKMSEQAKEILLQFFKFENLVLLMQIANSSIDFKISTEKNIIDLKTTLNQIKKQGDSKYIVTESILVPFEQTYIKQ